MKIEKAHSADEKAVIELLTANGLPVEGVETAFDRFLVGRNEAGEVVACGGIEGAGEVGLIRSVAVAESSRGNGSGIRIVEDLVKMARSEGFRELVLLTTTAQDFFGAKLGFQLTDRERYNEALADCCEWNLPHCSSAVAMCKEIAA